MTGLGKGPGTHGIKVTVGICVIKDSVKLWSSQKQVTIKFFFSDVAFP